MTYTFLQNYWWVLIALLGGLLVALMFVQGANVLLGSRKLDTNHKRMILNSTGRKWELTFTTLVTFGGAFFASFPLFYSTSFGGAYWVWVLLLVTFVFPRSSWVRPSAHSSRALRSRSTRPPSRIRAPRSSALGEVPGTVWRPWRNPTRCFWA